MSTFQKHCTFPGKIVIIGFGCVGQGVLPLLLRHIEIRPDQIEILTADRGGLEVAQEYGVAHRIAPLTRSNHRSLLEPRLASGDFLLNLSVDVSSVDLIALCHERGALYLDTCIEPWAGGYVDPTKSASQRSNYALREESLALRRRDRTGPTALLTHGANPGLVSHFVKQAMLNIGADTGLPEAAPRTREEWAQLAHRLGIKVIHVAERDTQVAEPRKSLDEFCNTWSVDGFVGEGCQPAELGWGSHERHFPEDGRRHEFGCKAAIYLARPGASTRVRTWTPLAGPIHGFLITHGESISIADYLSLGTGDAPRYRPTVHYAYHPCDDAVLSVHELAGRNWHLQAKHRVFKDDIVDGTDELGVLLMGHKKGAYWYGSRLSIAEARRLCPHNSATSLQVTSGVMAGVIWAMRNPDRDVIDPDDIPYDEIIELCRPYLGELVGAYTDWTPLADRGRLFPERVDPDDPWQFKNFRVV